MIVNNPLPCTKAWKTLFGQFLILDLNLRSRSVWDIESLIFKLSFLVFQFKYIVGSRGVVQLGGPVLTCAVGVPLKLRPVRLIYSLKVPLKSKENQNTRLIKMITLCFISLCFTVLCISKVSHLIMERKIKIIIRQILSGC